MKKSLKFCALIFKTILFRQQRPPTLNTCYLPIVNLSIMILMNFWRNIKIFHRYLQSSHFQVFRTLTQSQLQHIQNNIKRYKNFSETIFWSVLYGCTLIVEGQVSQYKQSIRLRSLQIESRGLIRKENRQNLRTDWKIRSFLLPIKILALEARKTVRF